jgi:hypothetical protein
MKTTIEIPDPLFRQAKVQAARDGLALRDLFVRGLQLALQTQPAAPPKSKANFPFIHASKNAPRLTDEQVAVALNSEEDLT